VTRRIDKFLTVLEEYGIGMCMLVSLVILVVNVILRYLFHASLSWPAELSTYLMILLVYLGSSAGIKHDSELKVDFIVDVFPRTGKFFAVWLNIVRLAACVIFFWAGISVVQMEYAFSNVSPTLRLPLWILFGVLPFAAVLFAVRTLLSFREIFADRSTGKQEG